MQGARCKVQGARCKVQGARCFREQLYFLMDACVIMCHAGHNIFQIKKIGCSRRDLNPRLQVHKTCALTN